MVISAASMMLLLHCVLAVFFFSVERVFTQLLRAEQNRVYFLHSSLMSVSISCMGQVPYSLHALSCKSKHRNVTELIFPIPFVFLFYFVFRFCHHKQNGLFSIMFNNVWLFKREAGDSIILLD